MTATTKDNRVEVAPGVWVDKSKAGDFNSRRRLLLLDNDGYELIGLKPKHADTLRRLYECGMIQIIMISPRVWFLDVDSWENHGDKCAENPWHWEKDGKPLQSYRATYR